MKILAERSNAIFLWGPFAILVSVLYFYLYFRFDISLTPRYYFWGFFATLFFSTIYSLVHRISLPRVLIEYDKAGIYIYNRRNKDPIIIRYEQLWSTTALAGEKESDDIDVPDYSFRGSEETITGYSSCNTMTGALRLELPDQFVKIHGVKNVRDVRRQLEKLIDENKRNKISFYEEQMEKKRREMDLEELAKHDPNT